MWICTYAQAWEEMWMPWFVENIPEYMLDVKRAVNGFDRTRKKIYFASGGEITGITYEQGHERVEAVVVNKCYMDEEPTDRRFYTALIEHSEKMSIQFTPIKGLSWCYEDLYLPHQAGVAADVELFHATQFDCPWRDAEADRRTIKLLKPWEVAAKKFAKDDSKDFLRS